MMSDGIIMTLVSVSWIMCPPPRIRFRHQSGVPPLALTGLAA